QRDDAQLRGKPVIVGGGVVLAASYEAKAFGIETAMGGRQARRLCPQAIVVPARFSAYAQASKAVYRVFDDMCPLVEGLSIDEAFLDVRGMERIAGTPVEIAARLRRRVLEEVGLPLTVGQVAWLEEKELVGLLGRAAGHQLHALAHNRDPRRVRVGRRRGSIGSQRAIGRSRVPRSTPEIEAVLYGLVDRVTRRLRRADRVGRTVVLRLRFDDFSRATRSHTLSRPTDETWVVLVTARWLLATALPLIERRGLTLVGITVAELENANAVQLRLPFEAHSSALDAALDMVRDRFGPNAIKRAVLLGRDEGLSPPLLPD
ncbi:MAG: DNA polymerase IV, partial [Nocardioides sp.]